LQCDQYLCKYCFTSCAIRRKRTTFKPDELADTFVSLNKQKQVDGLFLSSGSRPTLIPFVVGAVGESDRELLETVQRAHRELGLWESLFLGLLPDRALAPC
jgi:predicted DNA-binding helix-hairpin-helix protein